MCLRFDNNKLEDQPFGQSALRRYTNTWIPANSLDSRPARRQSGTNCFFLDLVFYLCKIPWKILFTLIVQVQVKPVADSREIKERNGELKLCKICVGGEGGNRSSQEGTTDKRTATEICISWDQIQKRENRITFWDRETRACTEWRILLWGELLYLDCLPTHKKRICRRLHKRHPRLCVEDSFVSLDSCHWFYVWCDNGSGEPGAISGPLWSDSAEPYRHCPFHICAAHQEEEGAGSDVTIWRNCVTKWYDVTTENNVTSANDVTAGEDATAAECSESLDDKRSQSRGTWFRCDHRYISIPRILFPLSWWPCTAIKVCFLFLRTVGSFICIFVTKFFSISVFSCCSLCLHVYTFAASNFSSKVKDRVKVKLKFQLLLNLRPQLRIHPEILSKMTTRKTTSQSERSLVSRKCSPSCPTSRHLTRNRKCVRGHVTFTSWWTRAGPCASSVTELCR